jgi:hypothetical protein
VLCSTMPWGETHQRTFLLCFFGALHTIQNNKKQKCINLCASSWCLYVINMHLLKWRTRCTPGFIPLFLILVKESFYFSLSLKFLLLLMNSILGEVITTTIDATQVHCVLWDLCSHSFFTFGVFVHYNV